MVRATGTSDGAVSGYAAAIVAVAQAEGALARVESELYSFARTVEAAPEVRDRLSDPAVPVEAKMAAIDELLGGRPQTSAAVMYVVQSGRARQLVEIADEVARLAAESRSESLAEVRSAVPLDAAQQERLKAALTSAVGRPIDLKVVVDPTVVGGVVARVGDTVIDGSLSRRLSELKSSLTGV